MTFETSNVEGKRHYVSEADFIRSLSMSMNGAPHAKRGEQANQIMAAAPYVRLVLMEPLPIEEKSGQIYFIARTGPKLAGPGAPAPMSRTGAGVSSANIFVDNRCVPETARAWAANPSGAANPVGERRTCRA